MTKMGDMIFQKVGLFRSEENVPLSRKQFG